MAADTNGGRDPLDDTGEVPPLPALELDSHDDLQDSGEGRIEDEDDDEDLAGPASTELVAELGLDERTRATELPEPGPPAPSAGGSTRVDDLAAKVDAAAREHARAVAQADANAPQEDRISTVRIAASAAEPTSETARLTPVASEGRTATARVPDVAQRGAPTERQDPISDQGVAVVAATPPPAPADTPAATSTGTGTSGRPAPAEGRAAPRHAAQATPTRVRLLMLAAALLPLLIAALLLVLGVPQAVLQRMKGRDRFEPNDVLDDARRLPLGTETELMLGAGDVDWFAIDAPPGQALTVEVSPPPRGRGAASLHGLDGVALASSRGGGAVERVVYLVPGRVGGASVPLRLRVWGTRGAYEVTARVAGASTRFEPNDTPEEAAPLEPGLLRGLQCNGSDWFRVRVPAGHPVRARIAQGHPALSLTWASAAPVTTAAREVTGRAVGADRVGLLHVAGPAGPYDLELALETPDAPVGALSDASAPLMPFSGEALEPNDRRQEARAIAPGRYKGLRLDGEDWYLLEVPPGAGAEVVLQFSNAAGDVELELYTPTSSQRVRHSTSSRDEERCRVGALELGGGPLLVRVFGPRNVDYTLVAVTGTDMVNAGVRIEPGEYPALVCGGTDLWTFSAAAGQVVELELRQDRDRWGLDFELLDAGWNQASCSRTEQGDGERWVSKLVYQVPRDGDLTLRATGGGTEYSMRLRVSDPGAAGPRPGAAGPPRAGGRPGPNAWQVAAQQRWIGTGVYPDQFVTDENLYLLDVAAGQRLSVFMDFKHAQGDIDLDLRDDQGALITTSSASGPGRDEERLEYVASRAQQLVLRAYGYGASNRYTLFVTHDGSAVPEDVGPGTRPGLRTTGNALFRVLVPGGKRLAAEIAFVAAQGDLDLQLLDARGVVMAKSESFSDRERVEYVAPVDEAVLLRVHNATNAFDLTVKLEDP